MMNLVCSSCFFFSSGFIGFCLSSASASAYCSSCHTFSDRMWLLFLFQNLKRLNSWMRSGSRGSMAATFLSILLLMATLSTCFSLNLTIKAAYLLERLSQSVMVWRLIVSSKTTYLISPLALQMTLPSSSQWKKQNSNLAPSFFMNSMQSFQLAFSLEAILSMELKALLLTPQRTSMKPSFMKISESSFSQIRVMALIVIRVSGIVLLTMRFFMFLAAQLAWICLCRSSFTASKKTLLLTFSVNLGPLRKVSIVRMILPTCWAWMSQREDSTQSPLRLLRSERSTWAVRMRSRSELSRYWCWLKTQISIR